ncbi:MAG: hypothetical protein LBV03_01505 [Fusobacteriales bacterium]|jgi:transposase|nr:hypothetical protein [Fusobacteriales bacterium]
MKRKSYPQNFKLGAINQVKAGKSISKASKELGEKAFSGNGNKIQNKDYEIEKLKKEIEELKKDNEILKKFHAFLARKRS